MRMDFKKKNHFSNGVFDLKYDFCIAQYKKKCTISRNEVAPTGKTKDITD